MGIEIILLMAIIPSAILITYAEEGRFKIGDFFGHCAFMGLIYACIFGAIALVSLMFCDVCDSVIVEEQRIDILSWERYEKDGNNKVDYIFLDDVGYKTETVSESFVYYNQKNEGEEDYIICRSYSFAKDWQDFILFNMFSDTYSIYTVKEKIIYSK